MQNYSLNDKVRYGIHGICIIDEIKDMEFSGKVGKYYVLKPIFDTRSTVFVPCDNELLVSRMKKILDIKEIRELIHIMPDAKQIYIENVAERKRKYSEILASGDRKALVMLIKTVYNERLRRMNAGKKPQASDEHFLKEAEKQLYEEFAYVLNIEKEDVLPFIMNEIKVSEKGAD